MANSNTGNPVNIYNLGGNIQNMPNATTGIMVTIGGDGGSNNAPTAFDLYFKDRIQCANYVTRMVQCQSTTDFARFIVRDIYKDMLADGRTEEEAKEILTSADFINKVTPLLLGYQDGKGVRNMQTAINKYVFGITSENKEENK